MCHFTLKLLSLIAKSISLIAETLIDQQICNPNSFRLAPRRSRREQPGHGLVDGRFYEVVARRW